MSVLIKGMEMPKSCNECIMRVDGKYGERCLLTNQYIDSIVDNCPLIALPEKNGRLIDADELIKKFHYGKEETETAKAWVAIIRREINHANTIVERER